MDKPSVEQITELVKKYHKRVGLRKIYKDFGITSADERKKYNKVWDAFVARIPDAYGKSDVQKEPEIAEDVEKTTP